MSMPSATYAERRTAVAVRLACYVELAKLRIAALVLVTVAVAALVWAKYPELTASQVAWRLTSTAADKGTPGRDPRYGFGIVDPVAALATDVASSPEPSPEPSFDPVNPESATAAPPTKGLAASTYWLGGAVCLVVLLAAGTVGVFLVIRSRRSAVSNNESRQ